MKVVSSEAGFEGAVEVVGEEMEGPFHVVTVIIPYRDIYGATKRGQARLVVRQQDVDRGRLLPAYCFVHYELTVDDAKQRCNEGWVAVTAAYTDEAGDFPGDLSFASSYTQAAAILQWVRRLSFVDRTRIHVAGGSQGGYMALAMGATCFPVCAVQADVPVVNWAYNVNYLKVNRPAARYPVSDMKESPIPVAASVMVLTDWAFRYFGDDLSAEAYYRVSPIAWVDRIGCPVLITCATGDMLVPMAQMTRSRDYLRPFERDRFPEGYQRDFDTLTLCEAARKTFDEVVPQEASAVYVLPRQDDSYVLTLGHFLQEEPESAAQPEPLDLPWSERRQWSFCYLDEGPPLPEGSHQSWKWNLTTKGFRQAHQTRTLRPEALMLPMLERLLERYSGELKNLPVLATGEPANRLNYPELEQLDVMTGLLDFIELGQAHEARLETLYGQCTLKPLGNRLDVPGLRARRDALLRELGLKGLGIRMNY